MSVLDFLALRKRLYDEATNPPECWGLIANSVYGKAEDWTVIALFDTEELAVAYREASRILELLRTKDGINRTFRPDSLLWNFNELFEVNGGIGRLTTSILDPHVPVETMPINPEPPTAPLEEVLAPYKAEVVAEALG